MNFTEIFKRCLADYEQMLNNNECKEIRFIRHDGRVAAIGNEEQINKILQLCIDTLKEKLNQQ